MNRLFHIAYREFAATVFTKAFFFGVVVVCAWLRAVPGGVR
jgi:hypothetical protein